MSSDYDTIALLTLVQTNLYKFGAPILIVVGTVSCILSLMVFTRKNLRKNPCSVYLVAYNISNFLLIYTSILSLTLSFAYNIDPSAYNLAFCRFHFYMIFLFDILSPSYLILASIDRILLTSRNAVTRQRSTARLAYICIITISLFWSLFHIHALVLTEIREVAPGFNLCSAQPGMHFILMGYYSLIIKGIMIPLLMIISGLWTVKNIRGLVGVIPTAVVPATGTMVMRNVHPSHSKDRQLLRILLVDISIYIIFNLMIVILFMYEQFDQYQSDSLVVIQLQTLLLNVSIFSTYIPYCVGCYTNLWASKTFRHEVKKVLMCK